VFVLGVPSRYQAKCDLLLKNRSQGKQHGGFKHTTFFLLQNSSQRRGGKAKVWPLCFVPNNSSIFISMEKIKQKMKAGQKSEGKMKKMLPFERLLASRLSF
jgi:hypothetical protein